ncbi:uncharacterized protein PpBr36_05856 [Pyricularia pennisetigena]|uniref:uncharacterized protein n=1 Tax=Pyricularia pennisetigena TaxID=1578925 RepID=UPI00114DD2C2|nr:uncharacterized protein PpBr36_05856 [Pyricularia pennisetigena]TLS23603.1 hypothetical protein PpBr36_05856 [Pyricularia pennisetigena]
MAPSNHARHFACMMRGQVPTKADSSSITLSTRQNDNSKDRDRGGRDRGSGRSGRGDDGSGSRGDRSNRGGGGRSFFGGRRTGDNDRNGDSSNNNRSRGNRGADNDSTSRSRALVTSSGAPAPAASMTNSTGTPQPPPAIASPSPKVEGANPVDNAASPSDGQAGRAPPAAVNPPLTTTNSNLSPVILLSTVIPDFANTVPRTTASPSAPALATDIPALPDTTPGPELANGINPARGTGAGSPNTPNSSKSYSDGAPAQQQQGPSQQAGVSMDVTTERVLISAGSIVSFAILCFVGWMLWRTVKRSKQQGEPSSFAKTSRNGDSDNAPAFYHKFAAKIPFLKNRQQLPWQEVNEKDSRSASLNRGIAVSATPAATPATSAMPATFATPASVNMTNGNEKANQPLPTLPRLQTSISALHQPQLNMSPAMGISPAGIGMSPGASSQSPARSLVNTPQVPQLQYDFNGLKTRPRESAVSFHQANNSFSSTNAAQFEGTFTSNGASAGTLMPPMLSPGYNRNEPSGDTYDAYNQRGRQDSYVSMLSSLSSGFGDGDIIVDDQPQSWPQPPPPQGLSAEQLSYVQTQAPSSHQQSLNIPPNARTSSRTSWMSRSNRDTVYTQASDDSAPRFRTVSSWVHQQTSRVRRAEHRAKANGQTSSVPGTTAPGWYDMPPEPQFNMMMDDGQAPRAPESVLGRRPSAPESVFGR